MTKQISTTKRNTAEIAKFYREQAIAAGVEDVEEYVRCWVEHYIKYTGGGE